MTLKEIRKLNYIPREQIAMLNGCSQMVVRRIEEKELKDITFGDIDMYVTASNLTADYIINMLLGINISEAELKASFWQLNFNRTMNVARTYKQLSGCSNRCSLVTLQTYAKAQDKYTHVKLNWCYFLITEQELG